ncbi:uncharacterized protein F4817DRAFT_315283 [Daldinia loculata]|uniref:uncharacterized protein n=1 Tax=Daldinia loculata TaxID=103429 RepID=UPI0020C38B91|nr:uncharacterized protein F4817DRAFT_315283 [Daldinia loculata]KAI1648043.1 hypothetical protein F4817DRAFT_315283 [Daldinia loculata]
MSVPASFQYYHPGVIVPTPEVAEEDQWSKDPITFRDGMVFIGSIKNHKVACVQSRSTGQILINKVYESGPWPGELPLELRISTAPFISHRRLPEPIVVNKVERIIFNELVAWQRIRDDQNAVFSLYFAYYNGGNLEQFMDRYFQLLLPIPEHFIWLVAERLAQAIRFFQFGTPPGGHHEQEDWEFISHRDLFPNNILIHYHGRRPGRQPNAGQETNAFPQIVVGDFGEANMENDDDDIISNGVLYFMGEVLRRMVQTHIPYGHAESDLDRPNGRPMNTVNSHIFAPYVPYSDELIEMLTHFEFPGSQNGAMITDTMQDPQGNTVPLSNSVPTAEWVVNTMLPLARRKVRRYRGFGNQPRGYFDALDVSWTRPRKMMPYEYTFRPVVQGGGNANNEHNDDDDAHSEHDDDDTHNEPDDNDANSEEDDDEDTHSGQGDSDTGISQMRKMLDRRDISMYERWNHIKPNFTTLWYKDPAVYDLPAGPPPAPLPPPPPGGDSDIDSTPDLDSDDGSNDDDLDGPDPDEDRTGNYRPGRSWNP